MKMAARMNAREAAYDVLKGSEERGAYSNLLLNATLERSGLPARERRLATELVYGVIQRRGTLDWMLDKLLKKGVKSLDPHVRRLLRIGLYQLAYLERIPDRAAVHETVELAKKKGHPGIASLVNGVLRAWLRRKGELAPPADPQTLEEKEAVYSFPAWLIRRTEELYGVETAREALLSTHVPPRVSLRANRLKGTRDELIARWNGVEDGEAIPSPIAPEGVLIEKGGNPAHSSLFQEGFYTIQDESSMLVTHAVDPSPGMQVLDMCAAPGGKTTHLAERMENQGRIVACDIHPHKLNLIHANATRLGIGIIEVKLADGRELGKILSPGEQFDAVLLDAPCSGLGVIRRKPDIKWSKDVERIEPLVHLQHELLDAAAGRVKPGGVLVYSTCTWEARENWKQIETFLARQPAFRPDPALAELLPSIVMKRAISGEGWIQILPHHFGSDGFFIARLKRIK
jgi:16S rRNA (cytosine967-C5)-methyltransferase